MPEGHRRARAKLAERHCARAGAISFFTHSPASRRPRRCPRPHLHVCASGSDASWLAGWLKNEIGCWLPGCLAALACYGAAACGWRARPSYHAKVCFACECLAGHLTTSLSVVCCLRKTLCALDELPSLRLRLRVLAPRKLCIWMKMRALHNVSPPASHARGGALSGTALVLLKCRYKHVALHLAHRD